MNENKDRLQLNSKNGGLTFALFIAGYILLSFVGQTLAKAIFGENTTAYIVVCSTFSSVCALAITLFYVFYGKHKFTFVTSTNSFGGWYLLLGLLLSAGMFLGLGFVNESLAQIITSLGLNAGGVKLAMPTVWHFLAYTLTFAILPAVFEEILFRGILLNCFAGMKRVVSVLICSLIFALYHQSLVQFLYQFIYGVALCYLALNAKSVLPCILAHFMNNFAVLLFNFLGVEIDLFSPLFIVLGANALAFFGAIIFMIERKCVKTQTVKGEALAFFLPYGGCGIIICLVIAISRLVA